MRGLQCLTMCLTMAASAGAVELTAVLSQPLDMGQDVKCWSVVVNPSAIPSQPPQCVVAAIPATASSLRWQATELWEKPPQVSDEEKARLAGNVATYNGWTRLTCGAVRDGAAWSFSCFDAGVIEQWEGRSMAGRFDGSASQLDTVVRAWWGAQR